MIQEDGQSSASESHLPARSLGSGESQNSPTLKKEKIKEKVKRSKSRQGKGALGRPKRPAGAGPAVGLGGLWAEGPFNPAPTPATPLIRAWRSQVRETAAPWAGGCRNQAHHLLPLATRGSCTPTKTCSSPWHDQCQFWSSAPRCNDYPLSHIFTGLERGFGCSSHVPHFFIEWLINDHLVQCAWCLVEMQIQGRGSSVNTFSLEVGREQVDGGGPFLPGFLEAVESGVHEDRRSWHLHWKASAGTAL